jgi:hypothetical protein
LPPTIVAKRGAHVGAPLRKEPSATAGHGVHRSDSINRTDAEPALGPAKGRTRGAQRDRVAESRPHSPSFSASPRLCGESCQRKAPLSAGHGVHRSFRNHLCSSVFIRVHPWLPNLPAERHTPRWAWGPSPGFTRRDNARRTAIEAVTRIGAS